MSKSSVPAFVAPILEGFTQTTHPIFVLLLESTFFTALLVPVLLSLLYFSTPTSRRTLVWNLVVLLVIIGLGSGAYSMHMMSQPFVDPLHSAVLTKSIPIVALWSIIPWLVDCVLLIRVISVYPPRTGKLFSFFAIITLPIALKIARLCLTSLFLVSFSHEVHTANLNIGGGSEAEILSDAHSKLPKGDWVLQLVDNAYMSGLFLWRLRAGFKDRVKTGQWDSLTAKLHTLFWIAVSNFVIPVLFNIVLLAIPFPSLNAIYVQLANVYVTLIAVVFATVWSTSQSQSTESTPYSSRSDPNAPISAVKWTPSVNPGHYSLPKYDHGVMNIASDHSSNVAPPTLVDSIPRYELRSFLPDRKVKV